MKNGALTMNLQYFKLQILTENSDRLSLFGFLLGTKRDDDWCILGCSKCVTNYDNFVISEAEDTSHYLCGGNI